MIALCAYLGAACMMLAPWTIDTPQGKLMAIAGLTLLTVQAIDLKAWNLLLLNLTGIAGYFYAYYF